MAQIIDMTPIRGNRGETLFKFDITFPSAGVKVLKDVFADADIAEMMGEAYVEDYVNKNFPRGMGEYCGVTPVNGGFSPVVNTYYSR